MYSQIQLNCAALYLEFCTPSLNDKVHRSSPAVIITLALTMYILAALCTLERGLNSDLVIILSVGMQFFVIDGNNLVEQPCLVLVV